MSAASHHHIFSFEAIGTIWTIDIFDAGIVESRIKTEGSVAELIDCFDKAYSRFRPDSVVSQAARKAGTYRFPDTFTPMIKLYHQAYELSGGRVTPLIGGMLADAGYDANYSLQPKPLTSLPAWDHVMHVDGSVLTTTEPVRLDFGAAGKGYLVDLVCEYLSAVGYRHFLVDAGGDMRYVAPPGAQPLDIGLEHPEDTSKVVGVSYLSNGALCGSAGNRRAWAGYTHIFDPTTRDSNRRLKAVWATASSAMLADMLTTLLYFVPAPDLTTSFNFEYAAIREDNSLSYSSGFSASFFNKV